MARAQNTELTDTEKEADRNAAQSRQRQAEYVQYTGGASIREISARQWSQAGVTDQAESRWTVENRHLVPVEQFTDAALEILARDGKFRIVTANEVS